MKLCLVSVTPTANNINYLHPIQLVKHQTVVVRKIMYQYLALSTAVEITKIKRFVTIIGAFFIKAHRESILIYKYY